jgi:hypothetical protein
MGLAKASATRNDITQMVADALDEHAENCMSAWGDQRIEEVWVMKEDGTIRLTMADGQVFFINVTKGA